MQVPAEIMRVLEQKVETKLSAELAPSRQRVKAKAAQMVGMSGMGRIGATPGARQTTDIAPAAGMQARIPGAAPPPTTTMGQPKMVGMQGGLKQPAPPSATPAIRPATPASDLRAEVARIQELAFQESKAKYAQEGGGPLEDLDEIRKRQVHWLPGLGGVMGGYWAGTRGAQALKERAEALTEEMRTRERPRLGKHTIEAAPSLRTRIRETKPPFWATKTRGSIGRHIGRKAIVPRAAARWGLRIGGPVAGLWAAKGLLGKRREPTYKELMEAGYGKSAAAMSEVLEKQGQSFFAEHPGLTAAGAGLLGAAAPWLARGIAGQAGYEFDPSALSLGGAALGAGAGLLASRSARKREYRKMMEKARRDAEMQRQQEMALMAMYGGGGGQGQEQMAPFGGQ